MIISGKAKKKYDTKTFFTALLTTGAMSIIEKDQYTGSIPNFTEILTQAIEEKTIIVNNGTYELYREPLGVFDYEEHYNYEKTKSIVLEPVKKLIPDFKKRFETVQELLTTELPKSIKLDKATTIFDVQKFIKSHLDLLQETNTKYQEPCLIRLENLQTILNTKNGK